MTTTVVPVTAATNPPIRTNPTDPMILRNSRLESSFLRDVVSLSSRLCDLVWCLGEGSGDTGQGQGRAAPGVPALALGLRDAGQAQCCEEIKILKTLAKEIQTDTIANIYFHVF